MKESHISDIASHIEKISGELTQIGSFSCERRYLGVEGIVEDFISHIMTALFPCHFGNAHARFVESEKRTWELMMAYDALNRALECLGKESVEAKEISIKLIDSLPEIEEMLNTDIIAAYEGDPAAKSTDEVILTYPAIKAITIYRVAHRLYTLQIPIIPRIMTEYAHKITGIDIHPGAQIGRYFFIDHGTGVVIGETTVIGEHVKLYQHVTLGAKNFPVGENGSLIKNLKRHPNIGNHVIIYAGATILGGDTYIGDNCTIGGNVWLTHSLESGKTVTNKE